MKTRPWLLLLAVGATLGPAACKCGGDQDRAPALVEQSAKLQNGLQVDLVAGPCTDSAALAVLVRVGIDHDPPGRSGMAQLAARILATSGATGRAERTVDVGDDYTLYSVVVASDRLPAELDDVAAWMSKPPAEPDVERERAKLLEEIGKLQGADAASTAVSLAEEAVRPTRGDGKRRGIAAEVKAITFAELSAFWEAHVKPGNARLTVAGRFDAAKIRAHVDAAFAPLPAGSPPAARKAADASVKGTLVMGDAPSAIAVAVPAPAPTDAMYPPFLILAARLLDKPASPRGWEASYDPLRRPDILFITGPVGPGEPPEPAAARIRADAATVLAQPPAPNDATRARDRFRLFLEPRSLDAALCTKDARAFAVARTRWTAEELATAPHTAALDTVTKEQLDDAAKLFAAKGSAAVIAGGAIH